MRGSNNNNITMRDGTGTSRHTGEEDNDGGGWLDYSFMKRENGNLEREEQMIYKHFTKLVKRWSWFVLIASFYMLLNVFIGFSSAPFYRKVDICSRFDPTVPCQDIMHKTDAIYYIESLAGVFALW